MRALLPFQINQKAALKPHSFCGETLIGAGLPEAGTATLTYTGAVIGPLEVEIPKTRYRNLSSYVVAIGAGAGSVSIEAPGMPKPLVRNYQVPANCPSRQAPSNEPLRFCGDRLLLVALGDEVEGPIEIAYSGAVEGPASAVAFAGFCQLAIRSVGNGAGRLTVSAPGVSVTRQFVIPSSCAK